MRQFFTAVLLIAASSFASWAQAQNPPTFAEVSAQTEQVGRAYFTAYIARAWDRLAPLMAENGSFADPTAEQIFGGVSHAGKEAVVDFFRTGYAGITEMSFKAQREIFTGHHAIIEGTLTWGLKLDDGLQVDTDAMPFVTILRVEEGLVVEHRDYADYAPFLAALRAARAAKADSSK